MNNEILIRNGFAPSLKKTTGTKVSKSIVGTIFANLAYYGFAPNKTLAEVITATDKASLEAWWNQVKPTLEKVTGNNRKIADFVVYKNFPKEVLDMSEGEYWFRQIFIYLGVPQGLLAQEEKERETSFESLQLKVLDMATPKTSAAIFDKLLTMGNRWTAEQLTWVQYFLGEKYPVKVSPPFKENLISTLESCYLLGSKFDPKLSAMDVLRLATTMSGGSADMKAKTKFRNFKRSERKFLLNLLDRDYQDLTEDFARDKEKWKRLLERLHPADYGARFAHTAKAYELLAKGEAYSNASWVEDCIARQDKEVFIYLRPGDFMRRLKQLYGVFGITAFTRFSLDAIPKLTKLQLLKIRRQLDWHNYRASRVFPPKGNWTKVKVADNTQEINQSHINVLIRKIDEELASRLKSFGPVVLDEAADLIKLQTNDSDLSPYGRGTVFPIPENINFIRSASYWKVGQARTVWFDNGWNFFDENWKSKGTCCWNSNTNGAGLNKAAVFSGDPVSGGEMKGRAAQMIDIYLDKMVANGMRYAVWNILCYSNIPFDDVEEVYGALQWGEDAQKNKLFEPSRCVLNFPLKGKNKTKYVAMIDAVERTITYLDANFAGEVSSAQRNEKTVAEIMPPFIEYLDALPSVYDLFRNAEAKMGKSKKFTYVGYNDDNIELAGQKAYVFKPTNTENSFESLNIGTLLND